MLIAGNFSFVYGVPAVGIVRLWAADFPPVLKHLARTADDVNLNWRAISNRTYRVQFSDDLSENSWMNLPGDVSATSDTATKTDTSSDGTDQRFYRVLQLP